jgi:hypothetical protein
MKKILSLLTLLLLVLCLSLPGLAQSAGYDLLQTGSGAFVDLTSQGLGIVSLQGVPIEACTGNTDTIMHRTQNVPTGGGTVPLVVTALFMKSTSPVTFNGQSVDVYVTINNSGGVISTSVLPQPDALTLSTGTITIRTTGTFDSSFNVNADVIFVKAGTSVTNSANWVGHQPAPTKTISSANSTWSSTPPSGYPSCSAFPSGGFYPTAMLHISGPHPTKPAACGTIATAQTTTTPRIVTCVVAQ